MQQVNLSPMGRLWLCIEDSGTGVDSNLVSNSIDRKKENRRLSQRDDDIAFSKAQAVTRR